MTLPIVLSIPHCGNKVPDDLAGDLALSPAQVAESEDSGTREVFGSMPVLACQAAQWSRLLIDLNRSADDLGPKGVIASADYFGRAVFKPGREPDRRETLSRVEDYHRPYHGKLAQSLALPGVRLLLDCHSMDGVGPKDAPDPGRTRADVNLGNNGGPDGQPDSKRGELTCPVDLVRSLAEALRGQGLSVSLNSPYAGGYITLHYGAVLRAQGKAALQMELNKALYSSPDGALQIPRLSWTRQAIEAALAKTAHLL
jgi:N-formylglutamate deformylase